MNTKVIDRPLGAGSKASGQFPKRVLSSGKVADHIVELVRKGRLRPGDRLLSEHELMRTFGVGRSSVREAVRGLVMAGILESKPRRGTVVVSKVANGFSQVVAKSVAYWGVREVEELRMVLECHAVQKAAELATPAQIRELETSLTQCEAKIRSGRSYFKENTKFHLAIAKMARNNALTQCLASIISDFKHTREEANWSPQVPEADLVEHRQIFDAIRKRQGAKARLQMEIHLGRNIERLRSA